MISFSVKINYPSIMAYENPELIQDVKVYIDNQFFLYIYSYIKNLKNNN